MILLIYQILCRLFTRSEFLILFVKLEDEIDFNMKKESQTVRISFNTFQALQQPGKKNRKNIDGWGTLNLESNKFVMKAESLFVQKICMHSTEIGLLPFRVF